MTGKQFHYTDSGLKNVWLANGFEILNSPYGKTVAFHDLDDLTRAIWLRGVVDGTNQARSIEYAR